MINFEEGNNNILKGYSMLLYFAGSFILNEPMESCIDDFARGDLLRKLPVSSDNPNYILASSFLNNINSNSSPEYNEILADYLTLFANSDIAQAPPYESFYLSQNQDNGHDSTKALKNLYKSYAWNSSNSLNLKEDHLGIEIQFLNLLLEKHSEIEDGVCHKELTKDIRKFIDNHFSRWIIEWNRDVQKSAQSNFYKGIGYLVVACTQDIYYLV